MFTRSKLSLPGRTRRRVFTASVLALIFPVDSQSQTVGLILDAGREVIGTGESDTFSLAETGRAEFDAVNVVIIRAESSLVGSETYSVSSEQTLAISNGSALLSSSAGDSATSGSITLTGNEIPGSQPRLSAGAGDFQSLKITGPADKTGTVVPVDIRYLFSLSLTSPDLDYAGSGAGRVWVLERQPVLTPGDIGFPDVYFFNEVFSAALIFDTATDVPELSIAETLDTSEVISLTVGEAYLVVLGAGGVVSQGTAGLSISGSAESSFSLDSCGIECDDLTVERDLTAGLLNRRSIINRPWFWKIIQSRMSE